VTALKHFNNGFAYLEIENRQAKAKIALQGAHIFEYTKEGEASLLWLSQKSLFENNKAIRGGIPVCFPWFGKNDKGKDLPQHGFARTMIWDVVLQEDLDECTTHIVLRLESNAATKKMWNYDFHVELDFLIGKQLQVSMHIKNCSTIPFDVTTALHTYFKISNINKVLLDGLSHNQYYDALTKKRGTHQDSTGFSQEVDRIYYAVPNKIYLQDEMRKVEIESFGAHSLVVWNPWIEKSKHMRDMTPDGYKTMLCLETANAGDDIVTIHPNQSHKIGAIYRIV